MLTKATEMLPNTTELLPKVAELLVSWALGWSSSHVRSLVSLLATAIIAAARATMQRSCNAPGALLDFAIAASEATECF